MSMSKPALKTVPKKKDVSDIPELFKKAVQEILQLNIRVHKSQGEDDLFENMIINIFKDNFGSLLVDINPEEFKIYYPETYESLKEEEYSFKPLEEMATGAPITLVRHPFGTNNWPDCVLIIGGTALPIEAKTSQEDKITWNGGLPRRDTPYFFCCKKGKEDLGGEKRRGTTIFLGRHVLTEENEGQMVLFQNFILDMSKKFTIATRHLIDNEIEKYEKIKTSLPEEVQLILERTKKEKELKEQQELNKETSKKKVNPKRPPTPLPATTNIPVEANSNFELYPRAMFNSKAKFFEEPDLRKKREKDSIKAIVAWAEKALLTRIPPPPKDDLNQKDTYSLSGNSVKKIEKTRFRN